jgi:hypothetical protein
MNLCLCCQRDFNFVVHIIISWSIVHAFIYSLIIPWICSAIYWLVSKIFACKIVTKKYIFIHVHSWPSWCHHPSKFILYVNDNMLLLVMVGLIGVIILFDGIV